MTWSLEELVHRDFAAEGHGSPQNREARKETEKCKRANNETVAEIPDEVEDNHVKSLHVVIYRLSVYGHVHSLSVHSPSPGKQFDPNGNSTMPLRSHIVRSPVSDDPKCDEHSFILISIVSYHWFLNLLKAPKRFRGIFPYCRSG